MPLPTPETLNPSKLIDGEAQRKEEEGGGVAS